MDRITVFIADDHELVRYAMRSLLEAEDDIEVVGEAADGPAAVDGVCEHNPDVVLLDMRMPQMSGVEVCRELANRCSESKVLVLTSFDDDEELFGVLANGACGYILKDTRPDRVVEAIRAVAEGQSVFDSKIASRIISGSKPPEEDTQLKEALSERELEVLRLMAKGMSNKEIGRALWIGETTVKTHVSHILRKLGQADRTQAVLVAVKAGLVSLSDGGKRR